MGTNGTKISLAAILTGALMAVASPTVAQAESTKSDRTTVPLSTVQSEVGTAASYSIRNYKSGKFLQPTGGSTANGAKIVQQSASTAAVQNWSIVGPEGTYYSFENVGSHKNLGIDGASTAAGAAAIQANPAGDANQDWQLVTDPDFPANHFALRNKKSQKCLGISGASEANGAQAAQFNCDWKANQMWAFAS